MIPTIYLVFVDDWELRGDGSGDPYQIQFKPMRELVRIFKRYGIRGSFNAEVMQQLTFRKYQGTYPELRAVANGWDEAVLETLRQGHDIQLHIHPQWRGARYERNGKWVLSADWSILNYEPQAAREMIPAGKEYLEGLLRHVDPKYRCVSFRSGSWCIAPSDHILTVLSELGIVFDMSIVGGVRYDNRNINLDYTKCQESFLPFYPEMTDARRIAQEPQPIVCVPTNHFREGTFPILKRDLRRLLGKISRPKRPAGDATEPAAAYTEWVVPLSLRVRFMRKLSSYLNGNVYVSLTLRNWTTACCP